MKDSRIIRTIDKNIGSLICFIFSALYKFKKKKSLTTRKNILLIELFEMGAAIMAYPSIKYIKKTIPDAKIFCLCTNKVRESWELLGIVPKENIFSINDRNLIIFAISLIRHIAILRKRDIDLVIDLGLFMRISSIISFLIKTKQRAGFFRYEVEGLYRGIFYDHKCSFNQNSHISKNFLALTKTAIHRENNYPNYKGKIESVELSLDQYIANKNIKEGLIEKIRLSYPRYNNNDLILVVPDVGKILSVRNYPRDSLVEVIDKLLTALPEHLVLLIGLIENEDICSYIHGAVNNNRCINFCGQTSSIRELVELMNFSKLLIGMDNGPIHFASLTPLKILALFSTDSPFMYGPLGNSVILYSFYHCSPCISAFNHKNSRCQKNLCLQAISPDTVVNYSLNLLKDKLNYRTINNEAHYI